MTDVDTLPRGDVTAALALAPHLSAVGAGLADPPGFRHYLHTLRKGALLAARVRCVVAEVGEQALTIAGHALGPGPMTGDERHARLVGDLTVYLRQHHAERSLVDLGRQSMGRCDG